MFAIDSHLHKNTSVEDLYNLIKISDIELSELSSQRESNIGTIRTLIELSLNLLNEVGYNDQIEEIINNWQFYLKNPDSDLGQIAQRVSNQVEYYFKNQIRTKLGEGIRLDSGDINFKAFLETLFDGNPKTMESLSKFINEYDLRQRISQHTLTYEGSNSIPFLRSHYNSIDSLSNLTREPIEDRNLHLFEHFKNFQNIAVIELSPPFYSNEDDFIVRYSYLENGQWKVTSLFLPLNKKQVRGGKNLEYINVKNFSRNLQSNILQSQGLKKSKVIKTSNKNNLQGEQYEMLDIFSNVNCLVFNPGTNIKESLDNLISDSLTSILDIENSVRIFEMNDLYVSSVIDGKLMPKVKKYSKQTINNIFSITNLQELQSYADQFGAIIHTSSARVSSEEFLKSKNYTNEDILKIKSGSLVDAAIKDGKNGVNKEVSNLSTGSFESEFSTSCGVTSERYGNSLNPQTINTSSWLSSVVSQHIDGIGNFDRKDMIDPNNSENKISLYRCNNCNDFGIDSCEVLKGCFKCGASYTQIVETAVEETKSKKVENKKKAEVEIPKSKIIPKKMPTQPKAESKVVTNVIEGALDFFTLGLASKAA